jgi:hypothetical protein
VTMVSGELASVALMKAALQRFATATISIALSPPRAVPRMGQVIPVPASRTRHRGNHARAMRSRNTALPAAPAYAEVST